MVKDDPSGRAIFTEVSARVISISSAETFASISIIFAP